MTDQKFGWRRENSSATLNAARVNNLYQKARPVSLGRTPDKEHDIQSLTDGQKRRPLRATASAKTINATDKPV
jgi:hypothetical protein